MGNWLGLFWNSTAPSVELALAYFYDVQNCHIPTDFKGDVVKVADKLRNHFGLSGKESLFFFACRQMKGDINEVTCTNDHLKRANVVAKYVGEGRNLADNAIMEYMEKWKEHLPIGSPIRVVLISGDGKLGKRAINLVGSDNIEIVAMENTCSSDLKSMLWRGELKIHAFENVVD